MRIAMICLALVAVLSVVCGEMVTLQPGTVWTYTSDGYPSANYKEGHQIFEFQTSPGAQIITVCTDFRMIPTKESPCDSFSMSLTDGSSNAQYCQNGDKVSFRTVGNRLKVEMKYKLGGLVSCIARTTASPNPNEIILEPSKNPQMVVDFPDRDLREPFFDRAWVIKSSDGQDLSVDCMVSITDTPPCNRAVVVMSNGKERAEACEQKSIVQTGTEVTVRAVLDQFGNGYVRCYASFEQTLPQEPEPEPEPPKPSGPEHSTLELNKGQAQKFTLGKPHQIVDIKYEGTDVHIFCDWTPSPQDKKENPCSFFEITLNDGSSLHKFCAEGSSYLNYFFKGSSVRLDSKFKAFQYAVNCHAVTLPDAEDVHLPIAQGVHGFQNKKEITEWHNMGWNFKSEPGTKISLQCDISTTSFEDARVCSEAIIRVKDGGEEQIHCGAKKLVIISKGPQMTVYSQIRENSHGDYFCKVQAVTGPDPNQINNLIADKSAEDAGEGRGRVGTTCSCGIRNHGKKHIQGRIWYGDNTKEGEYTWMVGIRNPSNSQRCGGSIITERHVLTAAHCMTNSARRKKDEIDETVIYVGAHNTYQDATHGKTKGYEVQETFIPEDWWNFKKRYDIAVLFLKEKIQFNEFVGPVCVSPSPPNLIYHGAKVIGWGLTEKGISAPELLTTKLFIKSRSDCDNQDYIICTLNKHSSTCNGDSGGPLTYLDADTNMYTQIGIVSYGEAPYCQSTSGFANVTYHLPFIKDVIKRTMPTAKLCQKN